MSEENRKKTLIGSIIGVVTLVIVVVGATYAFFSLNVSGDATNTNINIETGSADAVSIEPGVKNMHINLAVSDMASNSPLKAYYATDVLSEKYKTDIEAGTLTFATITSTNKEESNCTAKVTITMDTSTDSMGKVLQEGDAEVYIKSDKTEEAIDLHDLLSEEISSLVTKEIEVEISVSASTSSLIKGYLKINNTEIDQSYLAGKTLNITITVNNLVCEEKSAIEQILANSTSGTLESAEALEARNKELEASGVAEEDLDTLRRFVGTTTEVTDNYICFGTDDKDTCKNNLDQYMYRIIGIDEANNQIKVIKATKIVKGTIYRFRWHYVYLGSEKWDQSDLYKALNNKPIVTSSESAEEMYTESFIGSMYYSYMQDETWTNLIVKNPTWYDGEDLTIYTVERSYVQERSIKLENGDSIGLMYASDYLYAGEQDTINWLFIANGLNGIPNTGSPSAGTLQQPTAESEWTLNNENTSNQSYAFSVDERGTVEAVRRDYNHAVRPSFYLTLNNITLRGKGIISNPYIIKFN